MNKIAAIALKHRALKHQDGVPRHEGWMTRAEAAQQLGCAESRVAETLRAAIEAGDVETERFPEWDAIRMQPRKVQCYRVVEGKKKARDAGEKSPKPATKGSRRSNRPKPVAGMTVRSRRGGMGKITEIVRGRMRVDWDSGKKTEVTVKAIAKGDIFLEF
jgi:hypothetical protein